MSSYDRSASKAFHCALWEAINMNKTLTSLVWIPSYSLLLENLDTQYEIPNGVPNLQRRQGII